MPLIFYLNPQYVLELRYACPLHKTMEGGRGERPIKYELLQLSHPENLRDHYGEDVKVSKNNWSDKIELTKCQFKSCEPEPQFWMGGRMHLDSQYLPAGRTFVAGGDFLLHNAGQTEGQMPKNLCLLHKRCL